jgi:predicted site-specific integrase-resolvase
MSDEEQFKNVADVAEMFSVTPYTVREWLKDDRLPGAFKLNKQWKIPMSAIRALMQQTYGA